MAEFMNEPSPSDQNRSDLAGIMAWLLACYTLAEIAEAAGCGKAVTQEKPGEKVGAKVPEKMPEPLDDQDLRVDPEPLPAFVPEVVDNDDVSTEPDLRELVPQGEKPQLVALMPQGANRAVPARIPEPVSSAGGRNKGRAFVPYLEAPEVPEGDPSEEGGGTNATTCK